LLSTVILRIIKKMLESPKVSKAFYVIEHWLDLSISHLRSVRCMVISFQVKSFEVTVRPLHKIVSSFQITFRSFVNFKMATDNFLA